MGTRILLIEDEHPIADFLVRGLREEGFTVERAADGDEGWRQLQSSSWDVVLLDWWLPRQDGLTLLTKFREAGRDTPVVFLTARDAVSNRVRGLDAGADDYLCKPFAFAELLARIRVLTRRPKPTRTLLRHGTLSVDPASHCAQRGNKLLELTAKEESLLVFFLGHPGEVLSRSRIYETVWHERFDGMSNTLEVHIAELRRKLEAHGPRLIHTLRGQGYLFGESPRPESGKEP